MSDDLGDFLARAAQRRAEKANQQRGEQTRRESQKALQEVQSQYSDRRRERLVLLEEDEEVVEDEVVDAIAVSSSIPDAVLVRTVEANAPSVSANQKARPSQKPQVSTEQRGGIRSLELVEMLSRSGGIRQAFLLKEIIDRPVHRWD
jgi:hypothetical protein